MDKNKKILLYRIDEQAKNVIFAVTEDSESVWANITEENQTIIGFDDIFRDITAFRDSFLDYEKLTDELIGAINGRGEVFRDILARFDDNRLNSFNFFTRYYSDTLRDIFLSAREDIEKAGALFNTRALKKSTEFVRSTFDQIREVMRDDWNFDFNSESDLQILKVGYMKIIIRGNERNEVYTIADISLLNFFYDFSFAIHNMKLYVCGCKYCGKKFLGMKNAVCCDNDNCQSVYQKEQKNAKRREKDNAPYKKHINKLSNYIGQQKTKLPAAVLGRSDLVEKFDTQRKVFMKKMQDRVGVYDAENRLPDKKLDDFYDKMKQDVVSFVYSLKAEAEQG